VVIVRIASFVAKNGAIAQIDAIRTVNCVS
jgi:hypothetical protein